MHTLAAWRRSFACTSDRAAPQPQGWVPRPDSHLEPHEVVQVVQVAGSEERRRQRDAAPGRRPRHQQVGQQAAAEEELLKQRRRHPVAQRLRQGQVRDALRPQAAAVAGMPCCGAARPAEGQGKQRAGEQQHGQQQRQGEGRCQAGGAKAQGGGQRCGCLGRGAEGNATAGVTRSGERNVGQWSCRPSFHAPVP